MPVYIPQPAAYTSTLQIGRLTLGGPPTPIVEQVGDPATTLGGGVVPNQRTAPAYEFQLATSLGAGQSVATGQRLRRQLRSLLNNSPLKFQGFVYVQYSDDTEQNGWYVPDQTTLASIDNAAFLGAGLWQTAQGNWYLVGRRRTHREGRQVWMKDLRTGLYQRDQLGWILSTDFSSLPALQLTVLPAGASSIQSSFSLVAVATSTLPTGRDGGTCLQASGLGDLSVLSYERPEASLNLSDVIVYDRMGTLDAPSTGPDPLWAEVYGPDWPWSWLNAGQPNDAPVLDNGLIRVRFDASAGNPGFRIDVWNGSAYVEQGKVTVYRAGDSSGYCNTFVSANLMEWTPDRAVVEVVLANSSDNYSRERVFITVQRGELSAVFECYPTVKSTQAQADAQFTYTMNGPDSNDTILFEPSTAQPPASATDQVWSTASSNWTSASGTFSPSTSNLLAVLRSQGGATTVGPYQVNLAVVQQGLTFAGASDSSAYGSAQNAVKVAGSGGKGYTQLQVGYVATQADQVQGTTSSWTSTQVSQYRVMGLAGSTWTDYGEYTGTAVSTGSSTRVEAFMTQDRTRNSAIYGGCRDFAQAALSDSRTLGVVTARQ